MEIGKFIGGTDYIEEVAAYIRVSTQEQKLHGISLEAQVEKLTDYAEKNGMKIVEWYKDEGISGRKLIRKRPELQRMISDAQKGKFKRIIFIKLDRFFRSVAEYHECMKLIDPVIWTATEEKYDLSTANGRAFVNMKLTIAELEADQGGERIRIVNDYKIKTGQPLFGTQSMPFCYRVSTKTEGNQKIKIVEKNPDTIDLMDDLIQHYMMHQSIRGTAMYINKKYGLSHHYNAYSNLLRNEMICGSYRGNPNYCVPYVDRETFDRIQAMLAKNPRSTGPKRTYFFAGLIRCPGCGCRLTGTINNSQTANYKAYRCGKNRNQKTCDFKTAVIEKTIEQMMLDKVEDFVRDAKVRKAKVEEENVRVSKYDIESLQQELERLNYSWRKGRIKNVEDYDRDYEALMEQIAEAAKEQTAISHVDYSEVEQILTSGWKEMYMALDDEHKRAFWRSFVDEIRIHWGKGKKNHWIKDIIFF